MMKSKLVTIFYMLILLMMMFVRTDYAAPRQQISVGGLEPGGSGYPFQVAMTQVINESLPEVNVTLLSGSGAVDLLTRLSRGQVHFAPTDTANSWDLYHGTGKFEGKAFTKFRGFLTQEQIYMAFVVTRDSGVTSLEQLEGKPYFPGYSGSTAQLDLKMAFEKFGIKPNYFSGTLQDGQDALQNRRIIGMSKYSPAAGDAFWDSIYATLPLRHLSLSEAQINTYLGLKKGLAARVVVPSGLNRGQDKPIVSWGMSRSIAVSQDLSEDLVYAMFKAIHQDWIKGTKGKIGASTPGLANVEPAKLTAETADAMGIWLHPGVIKYLRELKYKIPEGALPPEMK